MPRAPSPALPLAIAALLVAGAVRAESSAAAATVPPRAAAEVAATPNAVTEPAVTPTSVAEPPETVEAREAFRLGSALARQGQWVDALAAFERLARLKAHPVTTFNIAYCERALGRYARAHRGFTLALTAPAGAEPSAALTDALATRARAFQTQLGQRIVRVEVTLAAAPLSIQVDGRPLEPLGDGSARAAFVTMGARDAGPLPSELELWLDPGTHVFVVTRPDGTRAVESHSFAAGQSAALVLGAASGGPGAAGPAAGREDIPRSVGVPHGASRGPRDANRAPAWIALGASAAALATGGIFAALAYGDKRSLDADPRCAGKRCPDEPAYDEQRARMATFSDVATVGLVVGAAGAAAGGVLWFTARPAQRGLHGAVRVTPHFGLGSAGVAGRF